ncbi:acyltransferase family protein [Psychromonas sp. MME2]|uniref:acyltransferase family protein n=1 Tax=unclassified Psychromonas TaxID=2614957 RepID=UPI00339BD283
MKPYPQKIASLEMMRVIAMLAVIIIHIRLFVDFPFSDGNAWLADIFNQLSRFAVPFFFILSGFFIQPKLINRPISTIHQYCKPLLKIWVVWSLICLLLPTRLDALMSKGYLAERIAYWDFLLENPLNSFLEGGLVHLWFLPALMIAVAIMAFFIRFRMLYLLLPVSFIVYLYGVFAGSYASLTELSAPFLTRNGPFFSLFMVVIGFEIRRREWRLSTSSALLLLTLGVVGHFVEAYWLFTKGVVFSSHDFLLFTPLWATGLFLLLLTKPNMGNHPITYYLSRSTLSIYASHLSIAIIFYNIVGAFAITGLPRDAIMLFGTVITTLLFVKVIEKTPLNKILFR